MITGLQRDVAPLPVRLRRMRVPSDDIIPPAGVWECPPESFSFPSSVGGAAGGGEASAYQRNVHSLEGDAGAKNFKDTTLDMD